MENEIDKQVQALYDTVQVKKNEIAKAERPSWKTNCSFGYSEESSSRKNIQVTTNIRDLVAMATFLIANEEAHKKACEFLGVKVVYSWLGYSSEEWLDDIKSRISKIEISKKKNDLEVLEKRLDALVSPELKRKLELESIVKALSDK